MKNIGDADALVLLIFLPVAILAHVMAMGLKLCKNAWRDGWDKF